jgi:hypothetical protein
VGRVLAETHVFERANARDQLRVYGEQHKLPHTGKVLTIDLVSGEAHKTVEVYRLECSGTPAWRFTWFD